MTSAGNEFRGVDRVVGDWGRYVLDFDWASHPFGPMDGWPEWMRTTTTLALASRFPIVLWFGRDLRLIYNEAYVGPLADKHPRALGEPGRVVWAEIWDVIEPMLEQVLETGVATWSDDQRLNILRHASLEECYFTFTYSPIFDEADGVGGIFCAVHETTQQVVAERRLRTLHELGSKLAGCKTVADCADAAIGVCESFPADLPFTGVYLRRDDGTGAPVLHRATAAVDAALRADAPSLGRWTDAGGSGRALELDLPRDLPSVSAAVDTSVADKVVLLPLSGATGSEPGAWMLIGISRERPFDDAYRSFVHLVAGQVGTAFASADAFQAEVRRAESLAELDRAKTVFFSNVSHEFRTPLTLILSPLEEALASSAADAGDHTERLAVAHRNALRLARLVDSLLDFSRIEAGRMSAQQTVVDLASLTADIASMFEAAFHRAGLAYTFTSDPEPVLAAVDAEMWEKIVLNLISNAFKYTHEGEVRVTVQAVDGFAETAVVDTGVGIGHDDLEQIFERFHRAPHAHGRSVEGTGIGLALVRDLVGLNGGSIAVESAPGRGSTFSVRLPLAAAQLTAGDRPGAAAAGNRRALAYVQEALGWVGSDDGYRLREEGSHPAGGETARVLVVDDNADMRDYLQHVLGRHWQVDVAPDAAAAMTAVAHHRPDLVVSDVMMPEQSGLDFVSELRALPGMRDVPVILLSARAGMEASLEGLERGADDYLTKPFVAADLVGRVRVRLEAAAQRRRETAEASAAAALAGCTAVEQVAEALFPVLHRMDAVLFCGVCVPSRSTPDLRAWYAGSLPAQFHTRYHLVPLDADLAITRAAREGTPQVYHDREALVAAYPHLEPEIAAGRIEALVSWPLDAGGGESRGALLVAWDHPVEVGIRADLLTHIASLTAQAIASIRARNHEREVAERLQDGLLATRIRSRRVSVATRYAPADATIAVGGDWYDVFDLPGERVGIVAGDVVGKGLEAATVMGQLRSALAAAALDARTPQQAVERLEQFAARIAGSSGTTVVYLIFDPAEETLTYTRAGHPPPLIVPPAGPPFFLDDGQTWPLLYAAVPRNEATATCRFQAGSLLVLFTDGLIERRGESLDAGLAKLARLASEYRHVPVRMLTRRLLDELAPARERADDVALVALRTPASLTSAHVDVIPADITALAGARHRLRRWLEQQAIAPEALEEFLLAVGEATANAVEHGAGHGVPSPVTIEAAILGDDLVTAVSDTGSWKNTGVSGFLSGRGRGHLIMRGFTDDVDIETHRHGTTVSLRRRVG